MTGRSRGERAPKVSGDGAAEVPQPEGGGVLSQRLGIQVLISQEAKEALLEGSILEGK